jgi:hypothetical protein
LAVGRSSPRSGGSSRDSDAAISAPATLSRSGPSTTRLRQRLVRTTVADGTLPCQLDGLAGVRLPWRRRHLQAHFGQVHEGRRGHELLALQIHGAPARSSIRTLAWLSDLQVQSEPPLSQYWSHSTTLWPCLRPQIPARPKPNPSTASSVGLRRRSSIQMPRRRGSSARK